jgi:hypothetical protein
MTFTRPRVARRSSAAVAALVSLLVAAGCGSKLAAPAPTPSGDQAPVGLRNLEIATVDGHRAVLLRLSRAPSQVRHSSSSKPAQIVVQVWGPVGEDLPERSIPQFDPQVSEVRVSRKDGGLRVVLELLGDNPPEYSLHEMADWIMIRFASPQS